MRAFVLDHPRTPGGVRELPQPKPGKGEVLVHITAAAVNPIDWKTRDRYEGPFPKVLGQDFSGIVVGGGEEMHRYVIDDRIVGCARTHGAYAEYTVIPQESQAEPSAKIPEGVGDADAAALPTAGLTALAALNALTIKEETVLLIAGVLGGVGGFAAQLARARGARVLGTLHSGKEDLARSIGVTEPIAYDRENIIERVKTLAPNGIDALLDLVDDAEGMKQLGATVRRGGKAVSVIGAADIDWFKQRGIDAKNLVLAQSPESSHAGLRELLEMLEGGTLQTRIVAERELSDAEQALELSKTGSIDGKIILTIR